MTIGKTYVPRRLAIPAASMAAMLLAGCSSGNIGESWQCPLAETGSCDSVAAADPAVPDTGAAQALATGQPLRLLPRDMEAERAHLPAKESPSCEAECSFDPFGWLARLFGAETDGDRPDAQETKPTMTASAPGMAAAADVAVEAVPAAEEDTGADDLRTGEVVARIWIAPFVDANGVYREASHVRVVLEPAGWRLP